MPSRPGTRGSRYGAHERTLRPWREVARIYRDRHPGEPMSRSLAYFTGKMAIQKLIAKLRR